MLFGPISHKPFASTFPVSLVWALSVIFVLTGAVSIGHAQSLPRVPGAAISTLTPKPGFFSEPSIAVNPRNPRQVVAAYQDNAHVAYSTDSGRNWTSLDVAPPDFRVSGDVSITYDNQGHAILCFMAFDKLGTFSYWAHGASRSGLFIRRSLDGGKTWEANDIPIIQHPTAPGIPFEDKPYIVADQTDGPYGGNLYVGWTRWTLTDSELLFSRSTDGGKTWSKPIEIDNHPGLPRDDNGALEGFSGTVGPDGTIYAVWGDGNHIIFTTSQDGGRTFEPTRNIIDTAPIMFQVEGVSRSNGFPVIGIDPRGGKRGGNIYVTWGDYRNGDLDVFCSTSADHGATWSGAVRVNSDPIHNGADQFFPWLAVDPVDGSANVIFYDRRGDTRNQKEIVALARSTDGGRSFANYAWTQTPFDARGVFIGDYTGLAAMGGRVYGDWTEVPKAPKTADTAHKRYHNIVRVGVADFSAKLQAAAQ